MSDAVQRTAALDERVAPQLEQPAAATAWLAEAMAERTRPQQRLADLSCRAHPGGRERRRRGRQRPHLVAEPTLERIATLLLPKAEYRYLAEPEFYLPSRGPWQWQVPPELV
ncbi:hypothetical protein ACBI99_31805 [Nonomuraea sp. ATR24]|uniref:hypothetical protein n=1 Tax=unclassified Nonomuraea TaxID=2593643 RepID=UPI00340422A9